MGMFCLEKTQMKISSVILVGEAPAEGSKGDKCGTPLGMIVAHYSPPSLSAGQEKIRLQRS